ncbi:uncharacterized protein SCHCODRAFT_01106636 [Schizophyllum commune H4-8]|uniref:Uncharacterized protein n=1 Tax=Schizophyllum commune (strain H4-8 / FGSC 9210) TaxID=578458 RepID=D8QIP0_SCHCM|nr:uncharacterized protein SCHCODRAFT_01106636 [Schizophyllum commune H4-8]KAI5886081.1 hypothetical protein SCHCODRAFT_01106636 [Schizophyllum commune H4-8]
MWIRLPAEIRWYFIGPRQLDKSKTLVAIPNLHTIQALTLTKAADLLHKALSEAGDATRLPIICLIPLISTNFTTTHPLAIFAAHILEQCPFLRLQGLMTIGSIEPSYHAKEGEENHDFKMLLNTRDSLQGVLRSRFPDKVSCVAVIRTSGNAKSPNLT